MLRTLNRVVWMVGIGALTAGPVLAQDRDTTAIKRLEGQVEAITRELEELRLGGDVVAKADTSV